VSAIEVASTAIEARVSAIEVASTAIEARVSAIEDASRAIEARVSAIGVASTAVEASSKALMMDGNVVATSRVKHAVRCASSGTYDRTVDPLASSVCRSRYDEPVRLAHLVSVAALAVGAVIVAVACGGENGTGGDAGLAPGECDPNTMLQTSCWLPCGASDVEPVCDNGVWTCPAQPTEPTPEPDNVCQEYRGDASRPECSDGPSECGCNNESQFVWYCYGDGGFVDTGLSESGVDARLDAIGDAAPDVVADGPTDVTADAPDE
jgi:hypothetical protein